jgi:hypothetical protein
MFKRYKEVKTSSKLIALGIIALLATAITIRFEYNTLITLAVIAALAISFHIVATRPKTTISVVLSLIQALIVGYTSYYFGAYFGGLGFDFALFTLITLILMGVSTITIIYLAFRFSKGKVWVTLLLSFGILDACGILLTGLTNIDYITSLIIASVAGIGIAGIRSFKLIRKKLQPQHSETRKKIRNATASKTAIEYINKNKWNFIDAEQKNNSFIVDTGKNIAIIFPLNFSGVLSVGKKDIFYNDISLGNLFGELIEEAKTISNNAKIPQKYISVIALDTSNKYPLPNHKYDTINLTARSDSRDRIDNLVIANNRGISTYIETVSTLKDGYNKSFNALTEKNNN